jgi:tetratricopeptide (TPR) repeat protein
MASPELSRIIEQLKANADAPAERIALAQALIAAGDPAEACAVLEQLASPDANAWYLLGQARGLRQDRDGAIAAWRRTLEQNPRHQEAILGLAALLGAAGDYPVAAEAYALGLKGYPADSFLTLRLQSIAPGHPWLLVSAGDAAALEDGDLELALEYYQAAAQAAPKDPDILWRLAWAASRTGHGDWAATAWRKAVRLRPAVTQELYAAGRLALAGGEA